MDGSVGVVEWPILILEGRGRMGMGKVFKKDGREGRPSENNGRYPSLMLGMKMFFTRFSQKRKSAYEKCPHGMIFFYALS